MKRNTNGIFSASPYEQRITDALNGKILQNIYFTLDTITNQAQNISLFK